MIAKLKRGSSPTPGSLARQPRWGGTVREGVQEALTYALPHGRATAPVQK